MIKKEINQGVKWNDHKLKIKWIMEDLGLTSEDSRIQDPFKS